MEGMNEKEGMGGMSLGRRGWGDRAWVELRSVRRRCFLRSRVNKVFQEGRSKQLLEGF